MYLIPFIFVYKLVAFLFKTVLNIFRYAAIGFFMICFVIIDIAVTIIYYLGRYLTFGFTIISYVVYKFIKYILYGFTIISYLVYHFIRYVCLGIIFPIVYFNDLFAKAAKVNIKKRAIRQAEIERKEAARERNRRIDEENKKRLAEIKNKEKEEADWRKEQAKEEKEKQKKRTKADIYINKDVVIEKKKLSDHINSFFEAIGNLPKNIKGKLKNISFVKNAQNKKDINRQALLLDFDGADAEKSEMKVMYKYVGKDEEGKIVTGYFPAFSKVEVHSFLLSEGYEVYSIETNKWIQLLHGSGNAINRNKIKTRDLIFFVTQLSTYIKAGIPLVESLKILSKQFKSKTYERIFRFMNYDLTMGDNFSDAMNKQGNAFPRLLINMVKASEMTGELPEALDDMADYYTETDKTRKQMITAMIYPAIIFVIAVAAIVFIMVYVVPKFVAIYEGIDGAKIPAITIFVMNTSSFLQKNYIWLILGITIFITVFIYLFKNVKSFKTLVQWVLMHTPVVDNVIIYNEVTLFTKTFASLLSHNVFITDSMEILNKMTNNEIYKMLILDTITNLAKGEKISLAFKNHWAFPIPAYEMITTGERTGQLPEMMEKVSEYYQEMHRNAVTRIKTFVEPILIIFLTVVVGGIVLSIVIPMFDIYKVSGM